MNLRHDYHRQNSESGERKRTESESSTGATESKRKRSGESESSETGAEAATPTSLATESVSKSTPSTLTSDPGWDEDFNPFGVGGMTSPQKSTEETEEGEGSPKKKVKTHISKKEKKALDKLEAEEIAREEISTRLNKLFLQFLSLISVN